MTRPRSRRYKSKAISNKKSISGEASGTNEVRASVFQSNVDCQNNKLEYRVNLEIEESDDSKRSRVQGELIDTLVQSNVGSWESSR